MTEGYVYRIIAPGSNSVYVGQSTDPRRRFLEHKRLARGHRHDNPALANFLRKHQDAAIHPWPTNDMDTEEIADAQLCRDMGLNLLNCAPCGGRPPSQKGKKQTLAHINKRAAAQLGRKHTPESIEKNAEAHRGKKATPEARANMSAAQLGRKHTPETLVKMGAWKRTWHLGRKPSKKEGQTV